MTRFEAFCNTTTDLQAIADVDSFDRKRLLSVTFVASGTSNLYYAFNTGFCSAIFMDHKDLGAAQSDEPNSASEWRWVAADDRLEYYEASTSVAALNARNWEEAMDFDTLKTAVVNESSDFIRSYLTNRTIYKRNNADLQGAHSRTYDFILIRINAILAVADLVRRTDPEKGQEIYEQALNADKTGLLDRLKLGEFALWNETTNKSEDGKDINVVSINGSTTGFPQDIKIFGPPSVDYDEPRLVISTGGEFVPGTTSPVKYDVYVKNSDGLRMEKIIDAQTMNGSYQAFAYGAQVLWGPGVYVAGDEFSVTFQSSDVQIGSVKSGQLYR
tara:strand:+ start:1766 stop:2752 length:987 start_codon:yes stop_codon:yes gene_type:complete